ncbi:MAG: sigma 54-interacting transcriptional regulator [Candidatus Hydrogenedentota bacterium]
MRDNDESPGAMLKSNGEESSGKLLSTDLDGQRLCTMLSNISIGSEYVGALMIQRVKDADAYSQQDLEAMVALCRALGPLYQSVCAVEKMVLQHEHTRGEHHGEITLVGDSPQLQEVHTAISAANRSQLPILIQGETGTGKEVIARSFHASNNRSEKPFVAVECAATQEELFEIELFGHAKGAFNNVDNARIGCLEASNGGVLFLDAVNTLSMGSQAKLLRVLENFTFCPVGSNEEIRVDVRVVASVNGSLKEAITAGTFREDLYHQLSGIRIKVPPLRDRRSDIILLAEHFMAESCFQMNELPKTFSSEAVEKLESWNWPGNVRELRMCIDRAAAYSQSTIIRLKEIILHDTENALEPAKSLADLERTHIV